MKSFDVIAETRRRWTAEERRQIVAESETGSVSAVALEEEDKGPADRSITIEFGGGVMMRVPGDIPGDRIMALVRALRSAS